MQYKTIVLGLIEQNQALHEKLASSKRLHSEMTRLATQLRSDHLNLVEQLQQQHPQTAELLLKNQALEIVIRQLELDLQSESTDSNETFSLDAAMTFVSRNMPKKSLAD